MRVRTRAAIVAVVGLIGALLPAVTAGADSPPPPTSVVAYQFSGSPRVAHDISIEDVVTSPADAAVSYRWTTPSNTLRTLSTTDHYVPALADANAELLVDVTVSAPGYTTQVITLTPGNVAPDAFKLGALFFQTEPVVGIPLTASTQWDPTPASISYQWGVGSHIIPGATSQSYTPVAADYKKTLFLTETVSAPTYATVTKTEREYSVVNKRFSTIPVPTITGTPAIGRTLTAHSATWSPKASKYTYAWIVGGWTVGTGRTFTPTQSYMIGDTVTLQITGANEYLGPMTSRTSIATAPITAGQISAGTLSLSSSPRTNLQVCAVPMGWGDAVTDLVYSWTLGGESFSVGQSERCVLIPGGTEGEKLVVSATAALTGQNPVSASAKTATITRGTYRVTGPGSSIVGAVVAGSTVSVDSTNWSPEPTSVIVHWYIRRGFTNTRVASGPTYTIPAKYRGLRLYAKTQVSGPLFGSARDQTQQPKIGDGSFVTTVPTITGTPMVGSTLTAHHGSWQPSSGTVFSYQWFRSTDGGSPVGIAHATSMAHRVTSSDAGTALTVEVTARHSAYIRATVSSAPQPVAG